MRSSVRRGANTGETRQDENRCRAGLIVASHWAIATIIEANRQATDIPRAFGESIQRNKTIK